MGISSNNNNNKNIIQEDPQTHKCGGRLARDVASTDGRRSPRGPARGLEVGRIKIVFIDYN